MPSFEFLQWTDGTPAFRKSLASGSTSAFAAEAHGLAALAATDTVLTPRILHVDASEIVTERIEEGVPDKASWRQLGEQLGALHKLPQPCFGFDADTYCGATLQPNPRMKDGHAFFARHRLHYLADIALQSNLLASGEYDSVERLCSRLPSLIPDHGPALLHGDLWRGNLLFDKDGRPLVIDPACYWGWPEADLAMCALFGGFPPTFFESWENSFQPEPGWRERLPVYQLYHLLNHLTLFGSSYRASVTAILRQFG
ncbi:MAG: fructosamine kinase family protein [Halieaceae bacterium]|nr:fructosamine kinase family protein [Halieaceae bacterium]